MSSDPATLRPTSHRSLWLALYLALITLVAYFPAMSAGFIWDDDDYVINNETLRDTAGLIRIWTDPSATPQYYPFVHSTFWLEYQTWELYAPGYHIVNILIHLANALLLWKLCERLAIPGAWLVGLVFAIHPVHVESVAWITERKNVLSGLFYLGSAYFYLSFAGILRSKDISNSGDVEAPSSETWKHYFVSMALFVAALLSKTVTSTLPAALLVVIWWKLGRIERRHIVRLIPMFVLGIGFGLLTVWLEKYQVGADGIDWELSFVERCLIAGRAICFYASKLLVPIGLLFTYPRWEIDAAAWWQYLFPLVVLATIVVLFLGRNRWGRGPVAAVCFFAGTLFPALGFFDVYPMRFSFVADHFQYLASIGMIVLYIQIGFKILNRFVSIEALQGAKVGNITTAILSVALAVLTWNQTLIYNDLETLWRSTLAGNPTSWMAHNNLGALLNRRGDFAEAEVHLRESIRLKPNFADSISNLGKAREGQGDIQGALGHYEQAVEVSPFDAKALNNLGATYGALGRLAEAREVLERAIASNPKLASAYGNLGSVDASEGKIDAAIRNYEQSLEIDPSEIEIRINLARLLMQSGSFSSASEQLREVLDIEPRHPSALLNLGVVYVNQNRLNAAVEVFTQLLRDRPDDVRAMQNLAYVYNLLGRTDEANTLQSAADQLLNKR